MNAFDYGSRMIAKWLIRAYQKTISFDHGVLRIFYPNGYCKFHPSCSEYAAQAIDKKGVMHGSFLTLRRLLRCNPFSQGGIDEVP